ncbi:MAG: HIT family protein [Bacteroidetes bacterium]|nr:MAG: HIT family protein [Bacteroidota bacterium]
MASIFTRIVRGEIPAYKIAETDDFLAFLDVRPLVAGHTLVIPKQEIDYLFDLPEELYVGLHVFAREVARALQRAVPCVRIGTAVIGLEVPHAHIHLVPMNDMSDLSFSKARLNLSPDEMKALAESIRSHLVG